MDIGETEREFTIEPAEDPFETPQETPLPEPVKEPEPVRVPA